MKNKNSLRFKIEKQQRKSMKLKAGSLKTSIKLINLLLNWPKKYIEKTNTSNICNEISKLPWKLSNEVP